MLRLFRPLLAGLLGASLLLPGTAFAQGLQITTRYPAVTVDPGATAIFPLTITTDLPERVDLAVVQAPGGWTARVRGGGSTIEAVFTGGEEPPEATLEVEVPEDAAPGSQQVVLEASAGGLSERLTVDLRIEQVEAGAVSLTSQFPSLSGSSDATFQFDLELDNGTNQETTFSLEAIAPPRWRAEARPSGEQQASTAVVAAGASTRIQVTVTPPAGLTAGTYPILVRALGGPQPAEAELRVDITGTPQLSLDTADERLNARLTVGGSTTVNLLLTNTGSAPLTDLSLTPTPPQGWQVTFEPATIPELPAGDQVAVTATVQASESAIAGDYAVRLQATAEEADDAIEVRTTVETSPLGGILGLAVLGVVVVGLMLVFRRYGRR